MVLYFIAVALGSAALTGGGWYLARKMGYKKILAAIESVVDRWTDLVLSDDLAAAESALNESLRLIDQHFPLRDENRAAALKFISRGYFEQGNFPKAREWLVKAHEVLAACGADEIEVLHVRTDLLYLAWAAGRSAESLPEISEVIERLGKKRYKAWRRELARALNVRSLVLCSLDEWEKAEADSDRAVDISGRAGEDPMTLVAYLRNRGDILDYLKRDDEALDHLEEALVIAADEGEVEEAARLADRIHAWFGERPAGGEDKFWIGLMEELGEDESPEVSELREIMLALASESESNLEQAEKTLGESLAAAGPDSLGRAFLLRALARLLMDREDFGAASVHAAEAARIMDRRLTRVDPVALAQRLELGDAHLGAGGRDAAIAVYDRARELIESSEGASHPELPGVYLRLIEAIFDTGEIGRIRDYCRKGIEAMEKTGERSPLFCRFLYYLARAEMELGRPGEARTLLEKSLEVSSPFSDFEGDGATWFFLSSVEQALGDPDRALKSVEMARKNYERGAAVDDLTLGDIYARLSSIYAAKGDDGNCRRYAEEAMNAWVRDKARGPKEVSV